MVARGYFLNDAIFAGAFLNNAMVARGNFLTMPWLLGTMFE